MLEKTGKVKLSKKIHKKIDYAIPREIIESTIEQIVDFLFEKLSKKENVIINNFGVLTVYKRNAQTYYNVGLDKRISRPEYWSIKLIPNHNFLKLVKVRRETLRNTRVKP